MLYTVTVFKTDRRTTIGERMVKQMDLELEPEIYYEAIKFVNKTFSKTNGFRVEVRETYITRKNIMTGDTFQERFDTPYYCSPSSESFWCN